MLQIRSEKKQVCKSTPFPALFSVIYSFLQSSKDPSSTTEKRIYNVRCEFAMHTSAEIIVFQLKTIRCFIYRGSLFGAGFMTLHAHFGQLIFMKGSQRGS